MTNPIFIKRTASDKPAVLNENFNSCVSVGNRLVGHPKRKSTLNRKFCLLNNFVSDDQMS